MEMKNREPREVLCEAQGILHALDYIVSEDGAAAALEDALTRISCVLDNAFISKSYSDTEVSEK